MGWKLLQHSARISVPHRDIHYGLSTSMSIDTPISANDKLTVNASESVPRIRCGVASELALDLFGVDVPHVDHALHISRKSEVVPLNETQSRCTGYRARAKSWANHLLPALS
jgi:hypothetical protein